MILSLHQKSGTIDQLSEIVAILGPPSDEDLLEMSCNESSISLTSILAAARIRDSLQESLFQALGPFIAQKSKNILKLLPELLVYNPHKRLSASDAILFIQEQIWNVTWDERTVIENENVVHLKYITLV